MTETVAGELETFLKYLSGELSLCSPAQCVSFGAILAERRLSLVGEDADWKPRSGEGASMRQIMQAVWDHACGRAITPDQLSGFDADLTELGILVDPDRFGAYHAYRGIGLLRLTTQCCAPGADVAGALAVAHASLEMAAGSFLAEDFVNDSHLRKQWKNSSVQAEAGLQRRLVGVVRAVTGIRPDTVGSLRRDFVT